MNTEQKRRFFLAFVHACQDIGHGGIKDTVIFQSTPLFFNDWYVKIKRNSVARKPAYFTGSTLPKGWQEFEDFLESSFPQGIIREIKLQDDVPVTWDASRTNRTAPPPTNGYRKIYVLKDAAHLKYAVSNETDSQHERSQLGTSAHQMSRTKNEGP